MTILTWDLRSKIGTRAALTACGKGRATARVTKSVPEKKQSRNDCSQCHHSPLVALFFPFLVFLLGALFSSFSSVVFSSGFCLFSFLLFFPSPFSFRCCSPAPLRQWNMGPDQHAQLDDFSLFLPFAYRVSVILLAGRRFSGQSGLIQPY